MIKFITIIFLLGFQYSFGQKEENKNCKVEIYLLKKSLPNLDSTDELKGNFKVTKDDLQDTAFIKDFEFISYSIKRYTTKGRNNKTFIDETHLIKVSESITQRINNLGIPLCCGRQFALVVNGQIIYGGYFWNYFSSFGCDWTTAFAHGDCIEVLRKLPDYDFDDSQKDQRKNLILFDCLKQTNRMDKELSLLLPNQTKQFPIKSPKIH